MKTYKGVEIRTTSELRDPRGPSAVGKTRVVRMSDGVWERIGIEARRADTSIGELIRAVMAAWLDRDCDSDGGDGFMDTKTYEADAGQKGAGYRAGIEAYRRGVPYKK